MKPLRSIINLASVIALSMLLTLPSQAADALPEYSLKYDPSRDPFKDGASAIELAKDTNRRVLIEVGGEWCKWCHILDDFLDDNPDIKQRLHSTFVMLKINVSDANENSLFLKAFPKPLGYPHMYVTEKNGSILRSKDTADFLVNGKYSREQFSHFFDRWEIKNKLSLSTPLKQKTL
jgi:thiol:disulfide interchange protein